MISTVNLKEKIRRIDSKDLQKILSDINYNKSSNMEYEDSIISYLSNRLCNECFNEKELVEAMNIFFIDTLELIFGLLKENGLNKITVNKNRIEVILNNIKSRKESKKLNFNYDFCVALISRSTLILNGNDKEFSNSNFPTQYIIDKFEEINTIMLELLEKITSIFCDEFIGRDSAHREASKNINDAIKSSISVKKINKELLGAVLERTKGKFGVLYVPYLIRAGVYLAVVGTLGSLVANSYLKYKHIVENKGYLNVFKIVLLIYEAEYKERYKGS